MVIVVVVINGFPVSKHHCMLPRFACFKHHGIYHGIRWYSLLKVDNPRNKEINRRSTISCFKDIKC